MPEESMLDLNFLSLILNYQEKRLQSMGANAGANKRTGLNFSRRNLIEVKPESKFKLTYPLFV